MSLILHVRNFGKIKSADIDLGNYTLFVGDNNSGKSYIMQLISGIQNLLSTGIFQQTYKHNIQHGDEILLASSQINVDQLLKDSCKNINFYLEEHKQEIVNNLFKKKINIESLSLEIQNDGSEYEVILKEYNDFSDLFKTPMVEDKHIDEIEVVIKHHDKLIGDCIYSANLRYVVLMNMFFFIISKEYITESTYIPSSRTGIQLLYKNFYSTVAEQMFTDKPKVELNLTKPILDYMSFLQTYTIDENNVNKNEKLIQFFENVLIDGKLSVGFNNEIFYTSKDQVTTPMYLTSAMVNEIIPFWMLLTNKESVKQVLIDEVETSLHPKKQIEMARLLNRMGNAGFKLIASTHSDTMAAAINLLYILSKKKQAGQNVSEILNKLGYEDADLLEDEMYVYQFINKGDHSVVEEVPYIYGVGFDFKQFDDALDKLLHDAEEIIGGDYECSSEM